jgi:PAS domain S-box-containing protein
MVTSHRVSADSSVRSLGAEIIDSIDLPILVAGRDYTVASFNQAAAAFFSLAPADVGRSLGEIPVLSSVKRLAELCEDAVAHGASCQGEVRDAIGSWFVLRIAPYRGRDQQIAGAVLTLTNVTAFRESLEQAVHEREYTKSIINTVSHPLVVLDEDLQIQTANQAFYAMFQVSRGETQGIRLYELASANWTTRLQTLVKGSRSANGEFEGVEVEHEFPDVGRRTLLLNARRLSRQGKPGQMTLLALQDITERKHAEEKLRESERRFREMIDALPAAVYTTDAEGRVTHYNPACVQFFGRTPELGADQWCVSWKLFHADGTPMPHDECPMAIALKEGRIIRGAEAILERPDGTRSWVTPFPTPLRDAAGKIVGGINIVVDITESKRAEEKLERTVQERTAKLQESIAELERFSYTITHDMRAPLRAMQGFSTMLLSEAGRLSPESCDYLRRIINASQRMDALTQDALQYSKIVHGEIPLISVEPTALLQGILESYPTLQSPRADIQIVGALPPLIANEAGLNQCFSNLLGNAVKFVAPGVKPKVRVSAEIRDQFVRLWFEDNGIGIPPQHQHRIFDMFQQLDKSYEGTGIGLALVRKVAQRMGGKVGVESEAGKGSRFWLELKRA